MGTSDDKVKIGTRFFPFDAKKTTGAPGAKSVGARFGEVANRLEETNVLAVINTKLGTLADSALGTSCSNVMIGRECRTIGSCSMFVGGSHCRDICTAKYENRCSTVVGKLSAVPPFLVAEPVSVKIVEPNWNDIPSSILGYREKYTNCTAVQQSVTFRHTEMTRTGTKVAKSKVLRTGTKISANVGFKFPVVSGGGNIEFNKDITITDSNEETEETTRSLERTDPLLIPAMSEVVFDHKWIRREVPVKYIGTIVLDAQLGPNTEGKTLLSHALPNAIDRTFTFEGRVINSLLVEGQSVARQRNMSAKECAGTSEFVKVGEPYGD